MKLARAVSILVVGLALLTGCEEPKHLQHKDGGAGSGGTTGAAGRGGMGGIAGASGTGGGAGTSVAGVAGATGGTGGTAGASGTAGGAGASGATGGIAGTAGAGGTAGPGGRGGTSGTSGGAGASGTSGGAGASGTSGGAGASGGAGSGGTSGAAGRGGTSGGAGGGTGGAAGRGGAGGGGTGGAAGRGGTTGSGGSAGAGGTGGAAACSTSVPCGSDFFCSEGRCISDVVMVATGYDHTCAARKDGKHFCWGSNKTAQSGQPAGPNLPRPTEVTGLPPFRKLALGGGFSCVLTAANQVMCWGDDQYGQLGDGAYGGNRSSPALVTQYLDGTPLNGVTDIAAGTCHACALTSSGVYCWGCNSHEQIGLPVSTAQLPAAVLVNRSSGARTIAVGDLTSHFAGTDSICGWGWNANRVLSSLSTSTFFEPACFPLASVEQTTLPGNYGCARLTSEAVQCWGYVGTGSVMPPPGMPVTGALATALGGGTDHACLRDRTGAIKCWGSNYFGAVGDGSGADQPSPTAVVNAQRMALTSVLPTGLSASGTARHTCAILTDGSLHCWGYNEQGQVGNGLEYWGEATATPVRW